MPARLVALLAVCAFLLVSLHHLDAAPPVYEDEPWQASTAYSLLQHGVFGSDMFTGYHAMEQRYYGFMPLHPLLLAIFFRAFGVGLLQARLETVTLSLAILVLTFSIAERLFGAWVAALATSLLVFLRWTGLTYIQLTGMPLVDFARIARYDVLAATLGMAAFATYCWQRGRSGRAGLLLSGGLAGLAGLAHVYGLFWVIVLMALAAWDRRSTPAPAWILLGAGVVWLPYAAYVVPDLPDWRGQTAGYADRFALLDPRWYLQNVLQEYHRYGPGLGSGPPAVLRIGTWTAAVGVPLSLAALAWRAVRRCDAQARAIVVPGLLLPVLFAVFIRLKLVNYTLLELPIGAIALAWGLHWSARRLRRAGPVIVSALMVAIVAEGALQLLNLESGGARAAAYPEFAQHLRALLPSGARVLGLHTYWFGLQDYDYRTFWVPLAWGDEGLPLDQGLDREAPDVLLIDPRLRAYFQPDGGSSADDRQRFSAWLSAHQATVIGRLDDPVYGLIEVYRVARS